MKSIYFYRLSSLVIISLISILLMGTTAHAQQETRPDLIIGKINQIGTASNITRVEVVNRGPGNYQGSVTLTALYYDRQGKLIAEDRTGNTVTLNRSRGNFDFTDGPYGDTAKVTYIVDERNWIPEANENNNSKVVDGTSSIIDLAYQGITYSDPKKIELSIKNSGSVAADIATGNPVIGIQWYGENSTSLGSSPAVPMVSNFGSKTKLDPGVVASYSIAVDPPIGATKVWIVIDSTGKIAEGVIGERNNILIGDVPGSSPDLEITGITQEQVGQTSDVKFTTTIKNISTVAINLQNIKFTTSFQRAGHTVGTPTTTLLTAIANKSSLEPSGVISATITTTPPYDNPGPTAIGGEVQYFATEVDKDNVLIEKNEGNNVKSLYINPPRSNLAIVDVVFSGPTAATVTVKNVGKTSAKISDNGNPVNLVYGWLKAQRFYVDGKRLPLTNYTSGQTLAVGATITIPLTFTIPADVLNMQARIDFYGTSINGDATSDNEKIVPVPGVMPDLIVNSAELDTQSTSDAILTYKVFVENTGKGSLVIDKGQGKVIQVKGQWIASDGSEITAPVTKDIDISEPNLAPTVSRYGFLSFPKAPGTGAKIRFTVDPNGKFDESSEQNNTLEVVGPLVDLAVESLQANEQALVKYSIKNVSSKQFSGKVSGTYSYPSSTSSQFVQTIPEETLTLDPGQSVQKSVATPHRDPSKRGNQSFELEITTPVAEITKDNNKVSIFLFNLGIEPEKLVELEETHTLEEITGNKQASVSAILKKDKQNIFASTIEDMGIVLGDVGKKLQVSTTFDPQKKVELQNSHAIEKLVAANKLMDEGKPKKAIMRLKSYQKDTEDVAVTTKILAKEKPEVAEKLASNTIVNEVQHQLLFSKFNRVASTEDDKEIQKVQAKVYADIGNTVAVIDDPKKVSDAVAKGLTRENGVFSALHDAEILKKLEEHVPQEHKEVIDELKEENADQIKLQFSGIKGVYKNYIADYIEESGFDEEVAKESFDEYADVKIILDENEDYDYSEYIDENEEEQKYESESDMDEEEPYDSGVATTSGCPDIDDPVCGVDELNYTNECEAKDNNVEVAYKGECREESDNESSAGEEHGGESKDESEEDVQGASTWRFPNWWPFR